MNLFETIKNNLRESDSSFDVEGLADRIDILMSDMDPYEHMDVYGSYNPTEESYQDTLNSLYNNPQAVLNSISSYDIIDWEDDIQTEYNEVIQDLKEWIKISRVKNESEDSSKKGYSVTIKMKNNKQVIHLFNTEDEMYEYLNLLAHYVGQGEVEILDYTGKDSKKNESEYVVYTTTEVKPGEFKSDVYGKYTSSDQAEDVVAELKAKGINATMSLNESYRNPYAPTDEDWEDINHWYNDNYEEMWDNQAKRSWMTSEDIEWLSNQNHNTKLTEISMNYRPTGDVETDERRLNDLATTYFYDKVGIYNQNIDGLCNRWAHDQAIKINEAEGSKLSPEELVKSAYEHITSELGEEATVEAVLEDIVNNYDQDYFRGKTPEDSKNDFDSVKAYLRRLGLHYKDLDESETSNITYLDGDTILDDLGSDYECITAMYDALGVNTDEEFFPETIITDADNSNLYIRNVDGKTEWVLNKNGKAVVCVGRDSANIPIVYFDNEVVTEAEGESEDSNYKVDTRNLNLTNHGWHNNSDIVYGRVALLPKDKGSKLMPGHYDIIYFCETGDLFIFKLGTDVRTAVDYLYNYGSNDYDWVEWNGRRIKLDNIYDVLNDGKLKDVPQEQRDAIERAVNNAYYNEEPFPLDKVNYN